MTPRRADEQVRAARRRQPSQETPAFAAPRDQVAGHVHGHGAEPCLINAKDAAERGIKDGDLVRVFNNRGQIIAGAKVTESIRPGVIRVNEGGWHNPCEPGRPGALSRYGDVNVLNMDVPASKLGQGDGDHSVVGEVEKYTDPAVTVSGFNMLMRSRRPRSCALRSTAGMSATTRRLAARSRSPSFRR